MQKNRFRDKMIYGGTIFLGLEFLTNPYREYREQGIGNYCFIRDSSSPL